MSSIWSELADNFFTVDTITFVINTGALGWCYNEYRHRYHTYEAVYTSRQLEINEHLGQTLQEDYPRATCVHAVVRGRVKATEDLLKCRMSPNDRGVLYNFQTIDHVVKWSPMTRFWLHEKKVVHDHLDEVPFGLIPLYDNKPMVHIEEPLKSIVKPMRVVYDKFKPSLGGFSTGLLGWIQGERSEGIQETESILKENSIILAFGTLRCEENGAISLEPPTDGTEYILTFDSHTRLVGFLGDRYKEYRNICFLMGVVSAALGGYILYRLFKKYRRRYQEWLDSGAREEVRRKRRQSARTAEEGEPQCVICLSNIVEVMLLECGHLCLCTDCCDQMTDGRCPICRAVYTRRVAARLP